MAEKINFNAIYGDSSFDLLAIHNIFDTLKRTLYLSKFNEKSLIASFDRVMLYKDGSLAPKPEKELVRSLQRFIQNHLQSAAFFYDTKFKDLEKKYLVDGFYIPNGLFSMNIDIETIEEDLDIIFYSPECKPTKIFNQYLYHRDMAKQDNPNYKKSVEYLPSFYEVVNKYGEKQEKFTIHKVTYTKHDYSSDTVLTYGNYNPFSDIINDLDSLEFKNLPFDEEEAEKITYEIKKYIFMIYHNLRSAYILEIIIALYVNRKSYAGIAKAHRYNEKIKSEGIREYFKIKARVENAVEEEEEPIFGNHRGGGKTKGNNDSVINELDLPD